MGTSIYGSQDELVFELSIADRLRNGWGPRAVRVKVDDVVAVRAVDPSHLASWPGQRVLSIGREHRTTTRVMVLELARSAYDRIIVVTADPEGAVRALHRSGIGQLPDPVAA